MRGFFHIRRVRWRRRRRPACAGWPNFLSSTNPVELRRTEALDMSICAVCAILVGFATSVSCTSMPGERREPGSKPPLYPLAICSRDEREVACESDDASDAAHSPVPCGADEGWHLAVLLVFWLEYAHPLIGEHPSSTKIHSVAVTHSPRTLLFQPTVISRARPSGNNPAVGASHPH